MDTGIQIQISDSLKGIEEELKKMNEMWDKAIGLILEELAGIRNEIANAG